MSFKRLLLAATITSIVACSSQPESNIELAPSYDYRLTQRLNGVEQEVARLVDELTLEEKISLLHANSKFSIAAVERLGIHEMWMSDGPHGVRREINRHDWGDAGWEDDQSTYLPVLTAVAASWNPEMATLHGNVLGAEARERNKDVILGPGVNLARLPLYGRNFEYLGEDPFLAAELVVPEVIAIQNNDVAACVKHFALNTRELNRTGVNATPDERTLREVYLPAFEAAVKEGNTHTIMGAYNSFRGTNANQSHHLVNKILKGEWGYQGVLLTDWNVDINTYDAAMNGLDIEMGTNAPYDQFKLSKPLLEMVRAGKVPQSVIDEKVSRILRVQLSIGMMDKYRLSGERNTLAHQQAARAIAEQGVVLLKNDSVLPLKQDKLKHILVMGPNAQKIHSNGGGSSEVNALYEVTPLQGLKKLLGDQVKFTVLRGKGESLSPIAGDYILTRHWTGTPSWNISWYASAQRQQQLRADQVVDSSYQAKQKGRAEHISMNAEIKPLESGIHTLRLKSAGVFALTIDGKEVLRLNGKGEKSHDIQLNKGQVYNFEIRYDGHEQFTLGWNAPNNALADKEEYMEVAQNADAVIYFGGLSHSDDREAVDRPSMKLPNSQDEIIENLLAANPNTTLFMMGGSAVEMPWAAKAKAIVWGWYAGMEGGNVFADVLFGKVNPSGKLPVTFPEKLEHTAPIMLDDYHYDQVTYPEGVFIGYRWFERQKIKPLFPFGHGLSYTNFDYSQLALSSSTLQGDEVLTVTVEVKNTGPVAGAEIVQLYLHDVEASVERPLKELKGFSKVFLEPGESKTISLELSKRDLSFWDTPNEDWLAEPGEFEVMLGASVEDIRLRKRFIYQ